MCMFVYVFLEASGLYRDGVTTHSSILAGRIPWTEEPHSSLLNKSHKNLLVLARERNVSCWKRQKIVLIAPGKS